MALLSLAACSPKPVEQAPIRNPPNLAEDAYPPRGWAWSEIPGGEGPRRYGVASPPRAPKAEVLILPERSPAEAWFPTVNALVARGYTVWLADAQPTPLRTAVASSLIKNVIRKGSSGRLLILGEGRGAVAALATAGEATGVVLWSPVTGSAPVAVSRLELEAAKLLQVEAAGVLRPAGDGGVREGDVLAETWIKANPALAPAKPTYRDLYGYEQDREGVNRMTAAEGRGSPPVWMSGGDAAAKAVCRTLTTCKSIAPGLDPMIAAFDGLTKDVTLGAPPPPTGRKREPARKPTAA